MGEKIIRAQLPSIESSFDIVTAVNMGFLPGYSVIDKFGVNLDIDIASVPEDIWEGGGEYPFSSTADIVSASSSNNSDTQEIVVYGLDENWADTRQVVTLQGQTRVALSTPLIRVYRIENNGISNFAGTVYVYSGTEATLGVPSGASVVKAVVDDGNNQTLMAVYTIPAGKVGFLYRGEIGMELDTLPSTDQQLLRAHYKSRRFGKVFTVKKVITLMLAGSSNYKDRRSFADVIPAKTDIKLTVVSVSADNMGAWGTFDIMLVNEDRFSDAYLTAIGQPGY